MYSPSGRYIKIVSERKNILVFLSDILSIVSDGHYLDITLVQGTSLRSRMTASEFMNMAENDSRFLSVNKGIILNADYIFEIRNNCCTLENGSSFPVRVRDCQKIEQAVHDYNFEKLRTRQRHSR